MFYIDSISKAVVNLHNINIKNSQINRFMYLCNEEAVMNIKQMYMVNCSDEQGAFQQKSLFTIEAIDVLQIDNMTF